MASHPGRHPTRQHGRPSSSPAEAPGVRTPLTRDQVVDAALALIDAEGTEALTMRRLAQVLQRDPMRLYRHADSKAALLDAVTERVLESFRVPEETDGDWEAALRGAAESFRALALLHPKAVPLLVTRPLATPLGLRPLGTLRPLERLLDLFIRAGFRPEQALHAYRLFLGFLQGHVLNEVQELVEHPEEADALLRLGLYHLPVREFPRIRSVASVLVSYDGERELREGLDIVLSGLRAELAEGTSEAGAAS